jgi:hypothetical protein
MMQALVVALLGTPPLQSPGLQFPPAANVQFETVPPSVAHWAFASDAPKQASDTKVASAPTERVMENSFLPLRMLIELDMR